MSNMVEHVRINVLENGAYLKIDKFESPKGAELEDSLLDIGKVRFYSWYKKNVWE